MIYQKVWKRTGRPSKEGSEEAQQGALGGHFLAGGTQQGHEHLLHNTGTHHCLRRLFIPYFYCYKAKEFWATCVDFNNEMEKGETSSTSKCT